MTKLAIRLLEGNADWYERLRERFRAAAGNGDFGPLSDALGHDHESIDGEDDDLLSPEELKHDLGWAWENVRDQFLEGRGSEDQEIALGVARWLGVDVNGLENVADFDVLREELHARIAA